MKLLLLFSYAQNVPYVSSCRSFSVRMIANYTKSEKRPAGAHPPSVGFVKTLMKITYDLTKRNMVAVIAEAKAKFLPDAEYARAKAVDLKSLAKAQAQIVERYRKEVN